MKGARGWVIAGAIAVVIAVAALLLQPRQDSPEHSTDSDAANGASAALLFSQAMGHPTDQITGSFGTPAERSVMFVFTPTSPYTADEADRIHQRGLASGGTLIYASEQADPELDRAFGVKRLGGFVSGVEYQGTPVVDGVIRVAGGDGVMPLDPSPNQVPILRSPDGFVTGFVQRIGLGKLVVLADPLVICNGYLERVDNGRFLADLLSVGGADAHVAFDEYHHGLTVSDFAPQAWVSTPWGAALLWLLVAVFFGLVLRGRRFGPIIERQAEVPRSDAEWSVAVGQLLRRSSARGVALGLLAGATERAVAARTGLPLQPRERFWNALWVRAPELGHDLAAVENSLHASSATEQDMQDAASGLHAIEHPVLSVKTR